MAHTSKWSCEGERWELVNVWSPELGWVRVSRIIGPHGKPISAYASNLGGGIYEGKRPITDDDEPQNMLFSYPNWRIQRVVDAVESEVRRIAETHGVKKKRE